MTHSVFSPPRHLVVSSSDINSDGVLDEQELEALFTKEVSILEAMGAEDAQVSNVSPRDPSTPLRSPWMCVQGENYNSRQPLRQKEAARSGRVSQGLMGVEVVCVC